MHLKNIYKDQALEQGATSKDFLVVQKKLAALLTTEDYSVIQTECIAYRERLVLLSAEEHTSSVHPEPVEGW